MRHAIYVPLFGSLSDPHAVVDIDVALEESGWDGLIVETRQRARLLDEGVELLVALWKGDTVNDRGMLVAENVRAIPGPVQQPRIPIWFGSTRVDGAPIERPARYDGVFPDGVDASGIAQTDKAAGCGRNMGYARFTGCQPGRRASRKQRRQIRLINLAHGDGFFIYVSPVKADHSK